MRTGIEVKPNLGEVDLTRLLAIACIEVTRILGQRFTDTWC